jgi:hypothetical protein
VPNLGTRISHGECHIPTMERLLQNGMLNAQSDLELSLCEKNIEFVMIRSRFLFQSCEGW